MLSPSLPLGLLVSWSATHLLERASLIAQTYQSRLDDGLCQADTQFSRSYMHFKS
ncbi:hypothetical protein CGRA01v4_08741 [Colletotrichum graminicola]|nr:hypothetical protein CGRA01v4_08741 [Colletotrichum graminicola]